MNYPTKYVGNNNFELYPKLVYFGVVKFHYHSSNTLAYSSRSNTTHRLYLAPEQFVP